MRPTTRPWPKLTSPRPRNGPATGNHTPVINGVVGSLGRDGDALVHGRFDGSPKSPRPFNKDFTRFVAKLRTETREFPKRPDIPPITFHGLRHSHGTQLLKAGIHSKIARERLGHSTIPVTLDLHRHVTETMQEDAARMVDKALRVAINERTNGEQ